MRLAAVYEIVDVLVMMSLCC